MIIHVYDDYRSEKISIIFIKFIFRNSSENWFTKESNSPHGGRAYFVSP